VDEGVHRFPRFHDLEHRRGARIRAPDRHRVAHPERRELEPMSTGVRVEITRPIATALLAVDPDRPTSSGDWDEVARIFDDFSARHDVSCVVVRGLGRHAVAPPRPPEARSMDPAMARALRALRTCRHPTVAVIEGLCTGEALEVAACCDLRVCGESSRFGWPLARSGGRGSAAPLAEVLGWGPQL